MPTDDNFSQSPKAKPVAPAPTGPDYDKLKKQKKKDAWYKKKGWSAFKPEPKPGQDPEYDAFDPDKAAAPPAPKVPKLTDIAKP